MAFFFSLIGASVSYADTIKVPSALNGVKIVEVVFLDRNQPTNGTKTFVSVPRDGKAKTPPVSVFKWKIALLIGPKNSVVGNIPWSMAYITKD